MNPDFLAEIGQGGIIGGGAVGGAWVIITFIKGYLVELSKTMNDMNEKLTEFIKKSEITTARLELEVSFLKDKFTDLEKRIDKLEK